VSHPGLDIKGRVVVVAGGTTGIGRALTEGFADAGADVVATSRRPEEVEVTAAAVEQRGRRTLRIRTDVTRAESLEQARDEVLRAFGRVDVLVNCAGITRRKPTLEMDEAEFQSIMDVNFMGTLRACRVFAPPMLERGQGRIINIGSIATFIALYEVAAYSASKAAVGSLTKSLALEWGPRGVNVNAIAPGVFPTDLNRALLQTPRGAELLQRTPLKRYGRVEELQGAAVFLASDAASYVNGEVLVVDGGFLASGVNQ
jgi:NAD(P)-dependent dehydrogenase (short-subunit alcohol dehydrogenase family)